YASLRVGYWLTLLLAVPAAFFLIRLFIIQHDCGHAAFFRSTRTADIVGSILGVLTLTPYHYWKKTHALHHATSGNLEHRGFGDIDTLTVDEYLARSRWERFKYRVYRHPVVLFGVGAVLHFFVRHRIPTIVPREWTRERRSYYRLPRLLQWATGNIGLHHIHHLHPRIPNYRLQQALDDHAELRQVPTLTLWESLRCVRLTLWDERARKLVPFAAVSEVGT